MMACNDWIVCFFFLNLSPLHTSFFFLLLLVWNSIHRPFSFRATKQTNTCFSRFWSYLEKESEKRLENNELTFSFWFQTLSAVVNSTRVTQRGQGDLVTITSAVDDGLLFYLFIHFLFLTATFPRPPPPFSSSLCLLCVVVVQVCVCVWAFCLFVTGLFSLSFCYVGWFVTESRHGASHACHTRIDSSSRRRLRDRTSSAPIG